ncbi:hypothetical protein HIM_04453 [Hirsutella minnesotensis 3608]|uniref:Alpha-L-rhamnosidase C-terminal domain-containing protein n=1 Tax=Hirsutella minnesotensis 3608 TaxID=1043627 RepID=A0A0F8A188_9HYPO|nr:hypothetical protein HIM_04453 [Hirsutella minnesotensis 3608]
MSTSATELPGTQPFPPLTSSTAPGAEASRDNSVNRPASTSLSGRLRHASLTFEHSNPPEGFLVAAGSVASSIFSSQASPRPALFSIGASDVQPSQPENAITQPKNQPAAENIAQETKAVDMTASQTSARLSCEPPTAAPFPNGYHFPPKHSFCESVKLGTKAFWDYFLTPVGFLVTIYGLNVVAWGGMLFLLLCNASPAMCYPTCDDIESPRRKWVEIDSQILNALFCVTGFGLAPWRFRDLYFLLQYRRLHKDRSLRQLAGIHRGWFRLAGSDQLPVQLGPETVASIATDIATQRAIPYPENKIPDAPLTGVRARPTKVWKLDLVIWLMVWNTFFQCCLSGFMWGMDRFTRPAWATGLFVGLACSVAGVAGYIMFAEGKSVKAIEGVTVSQRDLHQLQHDREHGIWHYNNIKDKEVSEKDKGNVHEV